MKEGQTNKAMAEAVAAYSGPVTQCPTGKKPRRREAWPRSNTVKQRPPNPLTDAGWKNDAPDAREQHRLRQLKLEEKRERITKRNAPLLKKVAKQEKRNGANK